MKTRFVILIFIITACASSCIQNADTTEVSPSSVNMSATRLDRIDTLLLQSIDKKWINGAVAYVSRENKVAYFRAFGLADAETQKPMEKDAIFRIASQTKAITSVAVMMLFEEGKLLLDDPVSKYIPEFSKPTVVDEFNEKDTTYTTKPASREITIRDLLTHTSGIDYAGIGSPNMRAIYAKSDITAGFESRSILIGDNIKKLARLPLVHQPGERFTYGLNTDVLGYLVEVVSGLSFDHFLKQRIFEPLGMKDTYFYLPAEKHDRLTAVNTEDSLQKAVAWTEATLPGLDVNYPKSSGTYFSGGGGLSSTIADYAAFLQMILNKGELNGKRILAERTVEIMSANQIGNLTLGANKFGLGFEITTEAGQARLGVTTGSLAWGGFFGTTYWADPQEQMICLLFCQQWPLSHSEIFDKFRVLVYAAVEN